MPEVKSVPVYRISKTAQNMVMAHYADLLEEEGFMVGIVCPGYNSTSLNGFNQDGKHPTHGAEMILRAVGGEAKDYHGKLVHHDGVYPW